MNINVAVGNDLTKFCGEIDGKPFDYSVEEFINLIGAFQQVAAQAQGVELPKEEVISTENLPLEKIVVWYSIQNGGDGSAYPDWFLTESESERDQEDMDEGWGEPCTGSVETFIGSDIHLSALESRKV